MLLLYEHPVASSIFSKKINTLFYFLQKA